MSVLLSLGIMSQISMYLCGMISNPHCLSNPNICLCETCINMSGKCFEILGEGDSGVGIVCVRVGSVR